MPFALELSDNIDPTALATFVLAIVTVVSVLMARQALSQTQSEIEQTQSEIEVSRLAVEEAHRPVLIPVLDDSRSMTHRSTGTRPLRPSFVAAQHLLVPIQNIGAGPALDVDVSVTPRNDAGDYSEAWGDRKHAGKLVGLSVGEPVPVVISVAQLGDLPSFDLWITYSDVGDKNWVTTARYLARTEGGQYVGLSIDAAKP